VSVFLDTSAVLALLDADDRSHAAARAVWADLPGRADDLVNTNYVLVECFALVRHRLGLEAVRTLQEDILPLVRVHWASEADHRAGVTALLTANRRQLSLVGCVSFLGMRHVNLKTAFALDRDLNAQGFETLPAPPRV
jgi:predicted nucleic acid-binding protein